MSPPHSSSLRPALVVGLAFGLACCALLVVVTRGRAEQLKLRSELASLRQELAAARAVAPPPAPADATPHRQLPDPTNPSKETASALATAAPVSAENTENKRRLNADGMTAMLKSPMMQKIMASQTSAVTQMTYSRLMDRLELNPEERDYLQGLLVEKQSNLQNLGMQLMNPSLSPEDRSALMSQMGETWKAGEAKIRDFLNNDSDFTDYQAYSRQEPERKEVGMFAAALPDGQSLDAATSDALAKLQNDARKQFPFTVDFYDQENFGNTAALNGASVQRFLDEQSQFQSQVAEKAAALLDPKRLEIYKQNQAAVRQMSTMQLNTIVQLAGGGR